MVERPVISLLSVAKETKQRCSHPRLQVATDVPEIAAWWHEVGPYHLSGGHLTECDRDKDNVSEWFPWLR